MAVYYPPTENLPIFDGFVFDLGTENGSNSNNDTNTTGIVGVIHMVARTTLPSAKWLWCDGTAYLTTTYPALYAQVGTAYGTSTTSNPATSSTLANSPAGALNTITKTSALTIVSTAQPLIYTLTVTNNAGGSTLLTSPQGLSGSGSFTPVSAGSVLSVSNTLSDVQFLIYKDAVLWNTVIPTFASGGVNPISVTYTSISSTGTIGFTQFFGNYSATFTPDIGSATYTVYCKSTLTTTQSIAGSSTSYTLNCQAYSNTSYSSFINTTSVGTLSLVSSAPSGYAGSSVVYTGATLFNVPNFLGKSPVGADTVGVLTTTYNGSPVVSSGNRSISANQLTAHSHNFSHFHNYTQANLGNQYQAPEGGTKTTLQNIGGSSTATSQAQTNSPNGVVEINETATSGGTAQYLPPFSVINYIIRALA